MLERRSYPRQNVNSVVYVDVEPTNSAFLCDLGEGGIALDLLAPVRTNQVITLGFNLPDTTHRIKACGEVVWTDESGQRAGVRFADVPERLRRQISQQLSDPAVAVALDDGAAVTADVLETAESEAKDPLLAELRSALHTETRETVPKRLSFVLFFIGVVLVSGVLVLRDFNLGDGEESRQASSATTEENLSRLAPSSSPAAPGGAALVPGRSVVLQVAALKHENNAVAMVETLRKNKFPAYVLMPATDSYYRVQVGPFYDAQSADAARQSLHNLGLKPIVRR